MDTLSQAVEAATIDALTDVQELVNDKLLPSRNITQKTAVTVLNMLGFDVDHSGAVGSILTYGNGQVMVAPSDKWYSKEMQYRANFKRLQKLINNELNYRKDGI